MTTDHTKTKMNTIIFAPPKRGGILQSSGFLDLQCLMSLNRTCKAHVFDELSLIQLIENEVTRYHGVRTMQEAIHFWRYIFGKPSLKRWLRRGSNSSNSNGATDSITVTRYMLSDASRYEVMLAKMLRAVPTQSERLQLVSELGPFGRTLLYRVAESGNTESLKAVLAIHPESEHLKVVSREDEHGWTILHCAAYSGNAESIRFLLALYPETEYFNAVSMPDKHGWTALHCAGRSGNFEAMETILALHPESKRLQALHVANPLGETVLHRVAISNNIECIKAVLSLFPESQRLQVLNERNEKRSTVLDHMTANTRNTILEWLSQSESSVSKQP